MSEPVTELDVLNSDLADASDLLARAKKEAWGPEMIERLENVVRDLNEKIAKLPKGGPGGCG